MEEKDIAGLVAQLTLEEKAGLCSGRDNWFTKAVERLGIPSVRTSDGPHGLRTQQGETNSLEDRYSAPATCFPAACTTAASFDPALLEKMGQQLGKESQALGVNVVLGPGVNIKRSPLCGRNFEYFSEDPLLAGLMGAALVRGIQSQGVGACVKHFFANSQEHRRMDSSSEMDERTMREIYLPAFETVVREAQPWMVMASYNKIDGVYATANKKYLTDVLRGEFGFQGVVTSDWGATHDRAAAVEAGCDLTMPAENTDGELVRAVREGRLEESALDDCCRRLLKLAFRAAEGQKKDVPMDFESGDHLAREIAADSMVLLKNDCEILPLKKTAKVAFIGEFAKLPRYQGGGSSHINSYKVTGALEAAQAVGYDVTYAPGYHGDTTDDGLLREASALAAEGEVAVVFAGLTEQMETEGVDRRHMKMPESHNALIEAVCAANPNTVVVLYNGAPVEMPWVEQPKGILEGYLGGQAVGAATVDVLWGNTSPSGHLPESFPKKLSHNPSYLYYFGEGDQVHYSERFFVGYRYYTSKDLAPLFPFGHGLSYTTFSYENLTLDKKEMDDTDTLTVRLTVKNTGSRPGKALVQLYVAPPRKDVIRPVRELKAFRKEFLQPGEEKTVSFTLSRRDFAHWEEKAHDWRVETGNYRIQICRDADSVLTQETVTVRGTKPLRPMVYSVGMSMGDLAKSPEGYRALDESIGYLFEGMTASGFLPEQVLTLGKTLGGGKINLAAVDILAEKVQGSTGGSGLETLLGQPVSFLASFLPPERNNALEELMETLNKEEIR